MEQLILLFLDPFRNVLEYVLMISLLGAGLWLSIRLGFLQFRRLRHGIAVVRGDFDDPDAPGDMTHFQALTTALSATVGIGNIAGVALAIHWGGPGAIFWMWVTAILGMATKFSEVSLAQRFRVEMPDTDGKSGTVSGGPMHYIEQGLGKKWRPLALFFAFALILAAFVSGNAIQANTISDLMHTVFGLSPWISGCVTAAVVGLVIIGGISRIGRVTSYLAPSMAAIYVLGGITVIVLNAGEILPSIQLIFTEAFNPTAGVAGTGTGVFLQTLLWGVRRGLFSNEAGQGSAPIAHSAAKTDEPVSEGVVALLEPFIDTILICSITALVILTTGVWKQTTPTTLALSSGDISFVQQTDQGFEAVDPDFPLELNIQNGIQQEGATVLLAWHEVAIETFYVDAARTELFSGKIRFPESGGVAVAMGADGKETTQLHGQAVENGAPLTMWAYAEGLGSFGIYLVVFCVLLFGISTAISWSYYGDRCAIYLFGTKAILPYRVIYVGMHFLGAILSLEVVWDLGDMAMSLGTIPNVIALILLSGVVRKMSQEYFSKLPKKKA
ncbi:MAG: sodium:alanine symporter family protein [Bacteroidota bacterium]